MTREIISGKWSGRICLFFLAGCLFSNAYAHKFTLSDLVADTLFISTAADSIRPGAFAPVKVQDERSEAPTILGIQQTKKWRYIPVDQYIALKEPLATQLTKFLQKNSVSCEQTLVIDNLSFWYDSGPTFGAARALNGYTRLVDSTGQTLCGWQWELREKPVKKQKPADNIAILLNKWMIAQTEALQDQSVRSLPLTPYRYRRQMIPWMDLIGLRDGFIIIAHLTLDYPADQMPKFIRGSPGIYYRKSSRHESIAVGGRDQQWYFRLNPSWLGRLNTTMRVGFNNFNARKFSYVDYWNIMLINLSFNASIEYRPVCYRGLFLGAGVHQAVNLLPTVIKRMETGLLFSVGVVLP